MEDPRAVVEEIRATKFNIGASWKNPLAKEYNEAIRQLAACIYQKDLHFIMELVQNADDNKYVEGMEPEVEFVLLEEDIAGVGVEWTLLVLNNEIGFSRANVESLCSIGCSTKKGRRDSGYIGEKGIGFKSVFLVTRRPIIISNGYRISFSDCPTDCTDLGFIVPEWAEQPTDAELSNCLGISVKELPTTIIVLPIRKEKQQLMQEQLLQLSPQLVLFLNKLDKLSARKMSRKLVPMALNEHNCMSVHRCRLSPSVKMRAMVPNNCSYSIVSLSSPSRVATFHVWQQDFPVDRNHEVDDRRHIQTWTITLAFPFDHSAVNGSQPTLYAFLPLKVATGLPFTINSDFLLVSSRDALRLDSLWNKGILHCIPQAFISAFIFLLTSADSSTVASSLQDVYRYIPLKGVQWEPTQVQETILQQLKAENIILCDRNVGHQFRGMSDSCTSIRFFCQPSYAKTIDPSFRSLLEEAYSMHILPPKLLCSERLYIADAELQKEHGVMLSMMGVQSFTPEEYLECLRSPNWLSSLPEVLYVQLLVLLSKGLVRSELLSGVPLIKYVDDQDNIQFLTPSHKNTVSVYISGKQKDMPILRQWKSFFQRWLNVKFMPSSTVEMANDIAKDAFMSLCTWLKNTAGVQLLSVKSYAIGLASLSKKVANNTSLAIGTMHFILHAIHEGYLSADECERIMSELPLVDHSEAVHSKNVCVPILLPASICKWPTFRLHDCWKGHILCLSEQYLKLPSFMNRSTPISRLLRQTIKAADIFDIKSPPNAPLCITSLLGLAADDVKSFLTWLMGVYNVPFQLKSSLKENYWVKTMEHGDKKPCMSFLDLGQWENVLTSKDVPFVDTRFYGNLRDLRSILKDLGVVTKLEDGVQAVANHVQNLSKANVLYVQTSMASKWYKYLCNYNWMGWRNQNFEVIWVPTGQIGGLGAWKTLHECVISDEGGLFYDRMCVLNRHYKDEMVLQFFKDNMGVAVKPDTEKYCRLWVDWCRSRGAVGKKDCNSTWSIIARGWASVAEKSTSDLQDFRNNCRIPSASLESEKDSDTLWLARPSEVLYADNLILADIIQRAYPSFKFAWYPRSASASSWVDELVKCYTDLGVKPLSEAVVGEGPAFQMSRARGLPDAGRKGKTGKGLFRAMLGYLGDPKLMISAQARNRMVMQLKDVEVWHVDEVGMVEYKISASGQVFAASSTRHVRWEKGEKRIYVAAAGGCNKAQLAHEWAGEVAKGVVGGERALLVQGLQDFLLVASAIHFDDDAVQYLLCLRGLRLTLEDEAFLSLQHFETATTCCF